MKEKLSKELKRLGFTPSTKGYHYLSCAILIQINHRLPIPAMHLYWCVAIKFDTTPSRVERCMRSAIERAWLQGELDYIHSLFYSSISPLKDKPTNMQFITTMAEHLRMHAKVNN